MVEDAGRRDLHFGVADLLTTLFETRADVLDALGELGQRRQDVVLGNLGVIKYNYKKMQNKIILLLQKNRCFTCRGIG